MAKIAVVFPGIGYHTDKPLLYFSKKIARASGYEITDLHYEDLPHGIKGNAQKMQEAGQQALAQVEEQLRPLHLEDAEEVLFLAKSIGTAVAAAYAKQHGIPAHEVLYTPVEQTFPYVAQDPDAIAFHGTSDPWADTGAVIRLAREKNIPLYLTEGANHSLESADPMQDLKNLNVIMQHTWNYVAEHRKDPSDI